jgi:hypothetical protein
LAQELTRVAVKNASHTLAGSSQVGSRSDTIPSGAVSAVRKNTDANSAKPPTVAVDRDRATRIIDFQNSIVEENSEANYAPSQYADDY